MGLFDKISAYTSTPVLLCDNRKTVKRQTVAASSKVATKPQSQVNTNTKTTKLNPYRDYFIDEEYTEIADKTGLSEDLIRRIVKSETIKLERHKDPSGGTNFGIGHKLLPEDGDIGKNGLIPTQKIKETFINDLKRKRTIVENIKIKNGKEKFTWGQIEALVDLSFNCGEKALTEDTVLGRALRKGDYETAAEQFDYVLMNGEVNSGLCQRRIYDINRFCYGKHTTRTLNAMKKIKAKGLKVVKSQNRADYLKEADFYINNVENYLKTRKQVKTKNKKQVSQNNLGQNDFGKLTFK